LDTYIMEQEQCKEFKLFELSPAIHFDILLFHLSRFICSILKLVPTSSFHRLTRYYWFLFIFRAIDIDQILQFMVVACLELNRDSNVTYSIHISLPAGNNPGFPG